MAQVGPLLPVGADLGLGGGEDAIEAAEDGHGEHDFAVLGRAIGPRRVPAISRMRLTLSLK
jgi:hypothetical protein